MVVEVINVEDQGVRVRTNKQPSNKRWKSLVTKEEQQRLDGEAAVQELEQQRLHYEAALQEFERRLEANSGSCYAMGPTGSSSSCSSSSVSRAGEAAATAAALSEMRGRCFHPCWLCVEYEEVPVLRCCKPRVPDHASEGHLCQLCMDEIYGDARQCHTRAWARQQTKLARAHDLPRQQTMMNLHELARAHDLPNLELAYKAAEAEIAQQEAEDFFS